jgi:hypothetical protein
MAEDAVSWYGMDKRLKPVDHPPVPLDQALEIARRYYANANKFYTTGEEAIAETMFGFTRNADKTVFIEICMNGIDAISFRHEAPRADDGKGGGLFGGLFRSKLFQFETVLTSLPELESRIRDFYTLSPDMMQAACAVPSQSK